MAFQVQLKSAPGAAYSLSIPSGALTVVAAAGPVWSCRWTSTTHVALVQAVHISAVTTTGFTTAQDLAYGLYFARAYTVADTGGLAATLTTNNGKLDTSFPLMKMTNIRIGNAGVITAGTRTLDAQPLRSTGGNGAATIGAEVEANWDFDSPVSPALVLRAEEGLVLHNLVLMGAVGVVTLRVDLEWIEVNKSLV